MWCLETIIEINQELALGKSLQEVYDELRIKTIESSDEIEKLKKRQYCSDNNRAKSK